MELKDFEKLLDAKLETIHVTLNSIKVRMDRHEKKFAGKWVESVAIGALVGLLGGVGVILIGK